MSARYILDTNACIAIRNSFKGIASRDADKRAAAQRLVDRWKGLPSATVAMSVISLGELSVWVHKHAERSGAQRLLDQLTAKVTVLGIPHDGNAPGHASQVAQRYGALRASLETDGRRIGANDLWIAAHALALGLIVVTGNTSEFNRVDGLSIEDWTA